MPTVGFTLTPKSAWTVTGSLPSPPSGIVSVNVVWPSTVGNSPSPMSPPVRFAHSGVLREAERLHEKHRHLRPGDGAPRAEQSAAAAGAYSADGQLLDP